MAEQVETFEADLFAHRLDVGRVILEVVRRAVRGPIGVAGPPRVEFEGFSKSLDLEHFGVRQSPLATFIDHRVKRS